MDNFFRKIQKTDINSSYHNPYTFLTTENNGRSKTKRIGDFDTTLWMETAGLTVFMSLIILIPTLF